MFVSVSPGALSLSGNLGGEDEWMINDMLTMTCNGSIGTVRNNTPVMPRL